ncbi:RHS repeat protein [Marivirga sp. S37H4]|uniref:RHS repeat protein n=1 Tax=Marivirga aurantiaca TaxID=2802615 RepID=A0A934X2T0_9BACT|nr:RHS repeat domain-containing protein [Marivirga aurantiaca]MBK6267397.1 RHS repeat protein [Marivirga aurantiaca]
MKHFYQTVLLLFFATSLFAQEEVNFSEVIPPSPNVMAINKFVDVPVSLYTGSANVNVPLHTLKLNNFTLPVSLSYHSAGLKVDEIASFVGAGWTLNATGVISRTVNGLPDEYSGALGQGYFSEISKRAYQNDRVNFTEIEDCTISNPSINPIVTTGDPVNFLDSLSSGIIDVQSDLYHFSMPGRSGKFIFDHDRNIKKLSIDDMEVVQQPFQDGIPSISSDYEWEIMDDKGVKYYYHKPEVTEAYSVCGSGSSSIDVGDVKTYQSSWYLTKIIAFSDTIHFQYENELITYEQTLSESARVKGRLLISGLGHTGPSITNSHCKNNSTTQAKRLSGITTSSGDSIAFISNTARQDLSGAYQLDRMEVYKYNHFILAHQFYYGHFSNNKLKLTKVIQVDENQEELNPYSFDYFEGSLPALNSKSQDYWGYYNGAGNVSLLGQYKDEVYNVNKNNTNREPVLEFCRRGTLRRINYPTGGHSEFDYELHDFYDHENLETYFETLSLSGGTIDAPIDEFKQITVAQDCYVSIDKSSSDNIENYAEIRSPATTKINLTLNGQRYFLPAGTYWLYVKSGDATEKFITIEYEQLEPKNVKVGGLRLKKVTFTDPVKNTSPLIKEYTYVESNGNSSGLTFRKPVLAYTSTHQFGELVYNNVDVLVGCHDRSLVEYVNLSSQSQLPLAYVQGSHIGYSKVRVNKINQMGARSGYTEYKYVNENRVYDAYPFSPELKLNYTNGNILEEHVFAEAKTNPIQSVVYSYDDIESSDYIENLNFKMVNSTFCYSCDQEKFAYTVYRYQPVWSRLSSVEKRIPNNDGTSVKREITEYSYQDSVHHNIVSKTAYNLSDNDKKENTFYTYDNTNTGLNTGISTYAGDQQKEGVSIEFLDTRPMAVERWNNIKHTYYLSDQFLFNNRGEITSQIKYGDEGLMKHQQVFLRDKRENVIAHIENAKAGEVVFTSFEDNSQTNISFEESAVIPLSPFVRTGKSVYQLSQGDISITIDPGHYHLSFFGRNKSSLVVTKDGGTQISLNESGIANSDWAIYTATFELEENQTINISGDMMMDELRMIPSHSQITTFSYNRENKVSDITDHNNQTLYYNYDSFNRLISIVDPDKNVLKKFTYSQYKKESN